MGAKESERERAICESWKFPLSMYVRRSASTVGGVSCAELCDWPVTASLRAAPHGQGPCPRTRGHRPAALHRPIVNHCTGKSCKHYNSAGAPTNIYIVLPEGGLILGYNHITNEGYKITFK